MSEKFTVILDAGHGGNMPRGGSTPNNAVGAVGLREKDLTLSLARIAAGKLQSKGFRVVLTRDTDTNPALTERARKSKEIGADAFVSIHFNTDIDEKIDGTEVFVSNASDERDFALAKELLHNTAQAAETAPRGIRQTNFTVLKNDFHLPKTAACLIEMAYLTNPQQAQKLLSPAYVERLAEAVAQAISNYSTRFSYPKQDHEIAYNLLKPEKSSAHGFSYGLEDEVSSAHFLPLDAFSENYYDDFQTHAFDAKCGNSSEIKRGEEYTTFPKMSKISNHSGEKPNLFLRWCDIPKHSCEIDIVVHFHGFDIRADEEKKKKFFLEYAAAISGLDLVKPDNTLTRKTPTLCILPLGKNEPEYYVRDKDTKEYVRKINEDRYVFPFFNTDSGLPDLIDFSLDYLARKYKAAFSPGRLILTAHSGGGAGISTILELNLKGKLKLKKDIDEIHLFDSTYGNQQNFVNWANKKINTGRDGALRVLYLPFDHNCSRSGTVAGSLQIEKALNEKLRGISNSRFRVQPTRVRHNDIPKTFGFQLLADAGAKLDDTFAESRIHPCCRKEPAKCGVKEPFKQQSFDYDESVYFAESETGFMNY